MALSRFQWGTDPFLSSALAAPPRSADPFESFFPSSLLSRDVWGGGEQAGGVMTMRMDVKEGDKQYDVVADLPGASKEDIKVEFDQNVLRISAERKEEKKEENDRWHLTERRWGSVSRAVRLPQDADSTGINAKYENGVLRVTVPKSEKAQKKAAITVQ